MIPDPETENDSETTTATVYHAAFPDPDENEELYHVCADLRMGYDFVENESPDVDSVEDVFSEAYHEAGDVEVEDSPDVDDHGLASRAWNAWEQGEGHDPTEVRSMAVGDIIEVDGRASFVDRIGFEELDLDVDAEDTVVDRVDDRTRRALTEDMDVDADGERGATNVSGADDLYVVHSESDSEYVVDMSTGICDCADAKHNLDLAHDDPSTWCKHARRVAFMDGDLDVPLVVLDALAPELDGPVADHVDRRRRVR